MPKGQSKYDIDTLDIGEELTLYDVDFKEPLRPLAYRVKQVRWAAIRFVERVAPKRRFKVFPDKLANNVIVRRVK